MPAATASASAGRHGAEGPCSRIRAKVDVSAPAQNAAPAPASTIARTVGSARSDAAVCSRAEYMASSTALRFSGRFSSTSATPPTRLTNTRSLPLSDASVTGHPLDRRHGEVDSIAKLAIAFQDE